MLHILLLIIGSLSTANCYNLGLAYPLMNFPANGDQILDLRPIPGDNNNMILLYQSGLLYKFNANSVQLGDPWLNLTSEVYVKGEYGCFGMVFHPDYAEQGSPNKGKFYVNFGTRTNKNVVLLASWYTNSQGNVLLSSRENLYSWTKNQFNHNGGSLHTYKDSTTNSSFLYHTTGDGGAQNAPNGAFRDHPQDPSSVFGKVLRIQIDQAIGYSIPHDNPYVSNLDGDSRVYALGLRNPWRCWLNNLPGGDPTKLICGDVGGEVWEEINIIEKGGNYGWDEMEGPECLTGTCNISLYDLPSFSYIHPHKVPSSQPDPIVTGYSIIGGMGYQGPLTELVGNYTFADFTGGIYCLDATFTIPTVLVQQTPLIGSIRLNENGEMVFLSIGGPSQIWKLTN